ncbi:MAG: excinuclease ABC subunit UvrB [Spirochaetales bacterium]|nr:excinuclease ABC subunit UvrB [Spirochaetales bacterium]
MDFKVTADFDVAGDQGQAIDKLAAGVASGERFQTLKGVTGSGKTFTMAKIIERLNRPTLVISHNKTLAAQLYREFRDFFPNNAVEYFVSYYDYYQPEAYVAKHDLYIEKDASINQEIDRLRLSAAASLMERSDVIVVATVSCIYGLGNPEDYKGMRIELKKGGDDGPRRLASRLVALQYERNDAVLERGRFRVRGDVVEIGLASVKAALRIEFFGDEIERIRLVDPLTLETLEERERTFVYPAKYFVMPHERVERAIEKIRSELDARYRELLDAKKLVEAERLKTRTEYDLEMLSEMGYCPGIENYSRHLSGREAGERPWVLIDFFPDPFLTFIDESHVTLPQIGGMYEGDRSRKTSLVEYGFRLPSALDNRPLVFKEFEGLLDSVVYVSATPQAFELGKSSRVVEQLIRPTGLLDPAVEVRPTAGQIDDIYKEITLRVERGERSLVTTLTKKMAEELTDYLADLGLKVRYLHSEIETIERVEILKALRAGECDVVVGINLLREGLDLPEVSFIAILDADKIGFLRSTTSLVQIIGRAARNVNGTVVMYADRASDAMKEAIAETERRRAVQAAYNEEHHITPVTITKAVHDILERRIKEKEESERVEIEVLKKSYNLLVPRERKAYLRKLEEEMLEMAKNLEFERAAALRDEIKAVNEMFQPDSG